MLLASSSESSKSSLSLSFLAVSGGAGASGVLWSKQWNKSDCCKGRLLSRMTLHVKYILYTALNSPSLIFALIGSETDLPSINWPTIHLYYLILYKYLCSPSFKFALESEGKKGKNNLFHEIQENWALTKYNDFTVLTSLGLIVWYDSAEYLFSNNKSLIL